MGTSFDRSFLQILEQFKEGHVLDDGKLYDILGDEVLKLTLGGATLREFLEALADDGYLERKGKGYKLSPKGRKRIGHLTLSVMRDPSTQL